MYINDIKWNKCDENFRAQTGMIIKDKNGEVFLIGNAETYSGANYGDTIYAYSCGCCSCDYKIVKWAWVIKGLQTDHNIGIQVNGKYVGNINIPFNCDQNTVINVIKENGYRKEAVEAIKNVKKIVFVPNKLINFVT